MVTITFSRPRCCSSKAVSHAKRLRPPAFATYFKVIEILEMTSSLYNCQTLNPLTPGYVALALRSETNGCTRTPRPILFRFILREGKTSIQ